MSNFFAELFSSIFTPGPTPTLLVATNASFAALQLLLLALLIATYSVHFLILSFLSAGLWWAINWFASELQAAKAKEEEATRLRRPRSERESWDADESGTETEGADELVGQGQDRRREEGGLEPGDAQGALRRRRSLGEQSGEMSTDSEWEKVEEEDRDR
ncbi:MAG: hypothetical protein M1830_007277 [Pleopsidium flavum]|nr:MAG: hypothetical protein M1830_007277 [Pleopsidium flavum]